MAFSTDMVGIRWESGNYALQNVVGCIGRKETLMRDPRFRNVSQQGSGYQDCVAILSVEEAIEMASSYYDEASHSALDTFKKSLEDVSFVMVHIYEWESGM